MTSPSTWHFRWKLPTPFKNGDFQSIFARSAWTIAPSEKSSIITNRKSTTGFPVSLRWTVYDFTLPPQPPKEGLKLKLSVFRIKVDLSCKRSMLLVFWHRPRLTQSIVWPTPSLTTHPKVTHHTARFLCDIWATCYYLYYCDESLEWYNVHGDINCTCRGKYLAVTSTFYC